MDERRISRRECVVSASAALAAAALGRADQAAAPAPRIARRKLGRIGFEASIYALGTAEVPETDEAVRAIERALDGGVNYVDTAPSYRSSRAETAIGLVAAKRRADFFLATKTLERSADGAFDEVRASLRRLRCESIDLLQVHAVNDDAALAQVLGARGAVKGLEKARAEGFVRHVGITGHTRPEVISQALHEYPFESILVPVSAADRHLADFAESVVPEAVEKGVAVAGMKSLKGAENHGAFDPEPYLRYALSLPISTLTVGFRRASDVEADLAIAARFAPMSREEMHALEASTRAWATADVLWWKRR